MKTRLNECLRVGPDLRAGRGIANTLTARPAVGPYLKPIGRALLLGGILAASTLFAAEPAPAPAAETFTKAPDRAVDTVHDKNLYVVGYAHLDTQWRWTYPQVTREFIANTLHDNFALIEKYPNYVFNFSGSRRYEMMEEYYPDDFAKLKGYVAAGRWFPAGSSVDEADSVVPSAESLVRHMLYGNRYFRRTFGVASDEFMLPDCFGFPYALPTILAHGGIKGFSTQKLTWGSAVGIPFKVGVWEGPDGSSVVAALDPGSYTGKVTEDLSRNESWLARINATGAQSGAFVDYHYYGTGDRGGAPAEDSVKWIERSVAGTGPVRVISSRSDQMFKDLTPEQIAKLPRYQGELLLTQHSSGSISSEAYMKRWNRKNELLADAAERASVLAAWLGATPYPSKKLYDAWDLVLGSQMHDMLPGTSLPRAYDFCWNDEVLAGNQFSSVLTHAIGGVADALDTRAEGIALVVFNPLATARTDVVEATVTFPSGSPTAIAVIAPDGHAVPAQILGRDGVRLHLAFVASVPPVSATSFDVRAAQSASRDATLRASATGLENAHYRVGIAPNGDVASIYDKVAQRELLAGPARLAFQYEKPQMYPAWNMDWADQQRPPRGYVEGTAKIRVVESGPARVAVEIERESEGSRFVQTVRLAAGEAGDRVEFANRIDWQSRECCLKAAFPFTVHNPLATYDTQVGTLQRGNNDPKKYEVPQHEWFDLDASDGGFGVAVLNDSKYGSDKPDDSTLRLTLLYTPGVRNKYQDQASQDIGRHDILYAVTSHAGDWRAGQVPWAAARLNEPLLAFQTASHSGPLGRGFSAFQVSSPSVLLEAVKKAEGSDEVIVRFQELSGNAARAVHLAAGNGIVAAREVDAQERPIGPAQVQNGELVFDVRGYGLRAFALQLAAPRQTVPAPSSDAVTLPYNVDVVSRNANRADGRFDAEGRSYPAEQLPATIVAEGVTFAIGPTADGKANAVVAQGQAIALPSGDYDRLYLLAAADGDASGQFGIDGRTTELRIQNWTGYIGQWDRRLWEGEVPELAYTWFNALAGLEPGYTKPDSVAWFCSHRHTPTGDDHYQYSYLFKYALPLPRGAKTLTLPNNPKIRVFAVSVARDSHDATVAATRLFDQLDDHQPLAPEFVPAGGRFHDTTQVTLEHPLYWHTGGLHYTLDGSTPTASSPVYTGPLTLNRDTVVTACEFDPAGKPGPVGQAKFAIADKTAPKVVAAVATGGTTIGIVFSEPVERSAAEVVGHYSLASGGRVLGATATAANTVMLRVSAVGAADAITVTDMRDDSPAHNRLRSTTAKIDVATPVYVHASLPSGQTLRVEVPALPVAKGHPWTMNVFVRADQPLDNRTLIAGFGRADNQGEATGRYFGKFANGIHVWGRGPAELESTTPLAVGRWQMLTATYDGETLRLLVDGREVSSVEASLGADASVVELAPLDPWDHERRFQGELRDFAVWDRVLSPDAVQLLLRSPKE